MRLLFRAHRYTLTPDAAAPFYRGGDADGQCPDDFSQRCLRVVGEIGSDPLPVLFSRFLLYLPIRQKKRPFYLFFADAHLLEQCA